MSFSVIGLCIVHFAAFSLGGGRFFQTERFFQTRCSYSHILNNINVKKLPF